MWAAVGVLLGMLVITTIAGFHVGPHSHVLAGFLGVAAAALLIAIAIEGADATDYALLGADLTITTGVAALAYKGIKDRSSYLPHLGNRIVGGVGVATSDLDPSGAVRVAGEIWSATSLSGAIQAGSSITVINQNHMRLEVVPTTELGSSDNRLHPDEVTKLFSLPTGVVSEPLDPTDVTNRTEQAETISRDAGHSEPTKGD